MRSWQSPLSCRRIVVDCEVSLAKNAIIEYSITRVGVLLLNLNGEDGSMPAMKEDGFRVIKLKVSDEASRALDTIALSSHKKGEIVSELLLAAKRRLADVRAGTAPVDQFTEVLVQLEYERKFRSNQ